MLTRLLVIKGDKLTFVNKFGPCEYSSPVYMFNLEYFTADVGDFVLDNEISTILYVDAVTAIGTGIALYSDRPDISIVLIREP